MRTAREMAEAKGPPKHRGRHACGLAARRKALGLTLADVSAAVGVSLGYLNQIEHGVHLPSLPVAARLAAYYETAIETLWPGLATEPTSGE